MYPYLSVGPYLLQLPGVALLAGLWFGLGLVEKKAKVLRLKPQEMYNLVILALSAGFVGARLVYAGRFLSVYLEDPLSLVSLNLNTLSPLGGALIGLGAAAYYVRRKVIPLRPLLDALTPGLAIFLVFVAVAHFLSGEAFGAPAVLPWDIYLWDEYRHPSQVYEFLVASAIFLTVWRWPQSKPGSGTAFVGFVALTAGGRLFLEAFRGDSLLLAGGLRAAQVLSLAVLAACFWLLAKWDTSEANTE